MSVEELRGGPPERVVRADPAVPAGPERLDVERLDGASLDESRLAGGPQVEPRRLLLLVATLLAGGVLGASLHAQLPRDSPLELALGPATLTASPANAVATLVVQNRGTGPVEVLDLAGGTPGLSVSSAFVRPIALAAGSSAPMAVRIEPSCAVLDRAGMASVRVTVRATGGGRQELDLPVGGPGATWDQAFAGMCDSVSRYVVGADYLGPFTLPDAGTNGGTERPRFTWLMRLRLLSRHTEDVSVTALRLPSRGARAGTEPDLPRRLTDRGVDLLGRITLPSCEQWRVDGTDNGLLMTLSTSTGGRSTLFMSLGAAFERDLAAAMAASCPPATPTSIALRHI